MEEETKKKEWKPKTMKTKTKNWKKELSISYFSINIFCAEVTFEATRASLPLDENKFKYIYTIYIHTYICTWIYILLYIFAYIYIPYEYA